MRIVLNVTAARTLPRGETSVLCHSGHQPVSRNNTPLGKYFLIVVWEKPRWGRAVRTLETVTGLRHVCPPLVKLQVTWMVSEEQPRFGSIQ